MHRGYIKVWRKVQDSGLLQMHGTLALFLYLLLEATHRKIRCGMVELERGQVSKGRYQLSEAVGLTPQQIRTCEKNLVLLGMIERKSTNKFCIYTIVNYNEYQDIDSTPNKQVTNNQQTTNKQVTTIQTHKHINTQEETKPERKRSATVTIKTFLEECKENNIERIPKDDPVFDFAEKNNIPLDMIRVCWQQFVRTNKETSKKQKDWRAAFRNCVRGNWYKLWFVEADGTIKETSQYRALKKDLGDTNVS